MLLKVLLLLLLFQLPIKSMEQRQELNTGNSVSFIYYPTSHSLIGHVELEINGKSWDLVKNPMGKNFQEMLTKATNDGEPFFRFLFNANSHQIQSAQANLRQKNGYYICSRVACHVLQEAGISHVPEPFNLTPLLAATYLMTGKKTGLNNVQSIEYYGNPSLLESILKIAPGITIETLTIISCTRIIVGFLPKNDQTLL